MDRFSLSSFLTVLKIQFEFFFFLSIKLNLVTDLANLYYSPEIGEYYFTSKEWKGGLQGTPVRVSSLFCSVKDTGLRTEKVMRKIRDSRPVHKVVNLPDHPNLVFFFHDGVFKLCDRFKDQPLSEFSGVQFKKLKIWTFLKSSFSGFISGVASLAFDPLSALYARYVNGVVLNEFPMLVFEEDLSRFGHDVYLVELRLRSKAIVPKDSLFLPLTRRLEGETGSDLFEKLIKITTSRCGKFVLMSFKHAEDRQDYLSKLVLLQIISKRRIRLLGVIHCFKLGLKALRNLCFCSVYSQKLVFCGMSHEANSSLLVIVYDHRMKKVLHLSVKKTTLFYCVKLWKDFVEDVVVGCDKVGNLVKVKL